MPAPGVSALTRLLCRTPAILALGLFAAPLPSAFADEPAPAGQRPRERHPSFAPVAERGDLPRVLIIGDSISMGCTLPLRELLAAQANVLRPAENCGDTGRGLERLGRWLGDGRWDVIVFNFGLHDLKYLDAQGRYTDRANGRQVNPPARYAENLAAMVAQLKRTGATLLFATTTPVPDGSVGRVAGDEFRYNAAAREVLARAEVGVIDLHEVIANGPAEWRRPANVHFTDAGYRGLAGEIARAVTDALAARRSPSP